MDLNLLRVFVAVAETASFSVAAQRLELPKSSVSRAVARLETDMGVQLVHRSTRRVALSTAGAALHEKIAPLLATLQRSICALPELEDGPSGRLRVTASIDFGAAVLADVVARFSARYPAVQLELRITNDLVDLIGEGVDLAVRLSSRPLRDSQLRARRAAPLHMQLFAAPAYLARRGTPRTPSDLEEHDWVAFRMGAPLRLEGADGATMVMPRGRISCDEIAFAHATVVAGAGIGYLPTFLTDPDIAAGRLTRVLPRWAAPSGHVWIVSPAGGRMPRKAEAFAEMVVETLARPLQLAR